MNVALETVRASVLLFSVSLGTKWRNEESFRRACGLSDPLYNHVTATLEAYRGWPLFRKFEKYREEHRRMALLLRDEIETVCTQMKPEESLVFVASFVPARRRGYSRERVGEMIGMTTVQIEALEKGAANIFLQSITNETPLLYHLVSTQPQDLELLRARHDPSFDLRTYMSAETELAIRQVLHQGRRERIADLLSLFPEKEQRLAASVRERMRFEILGSGRAEDGRVT
ncbi:hypothetical protein DNHGIG_20390 [Collibacillus ludicampi]|uniref:Uncharacterized protein n=1 Tax=Collibacillus ludicampi TaxID=2771369 RepID=A0AAV4LF49_9BACL|nr:hypothetical protein [Collibacillus ludicampi]GIM46490.1 hypothetical protein DNHGIG_20390 [Collibacillus ludicampi]